MANQLLISPNRALDANAYAAPGATATFYASGTSSLITVYSDQNGSVVAANPVVADANGIFAQTYALVNAKVIVRDAAGATLWTIDPVPTTNTQQAGASGISFAPTVDIPQTNVQAAIEAAAAFAASGFTDFGLGNAGNAPIISALNDTGTATGMYRFTGSTTGTFPTGVVASDTGLVTVDRQTSSEAMMMLREAGTNRLYVRFLTASAWQAWREIPSFAASPAPTNGQIIKSNGTVFAPGSSISRETYASGSGTSVTFDVPDWVQRVTINFNSVSTNGSSELTVRLADSGGVESTGYTGASAAVGNAVATVAGALSSGFRINGGAADTAGAIRSGTVVLTRVLSDGLTWACNATIAYENTPVVVMTAGTKALSDVLTQVRIITTNATDTFDAGGFSVLWE